MLDIVGVVVNFDVCAGLVEAFDKHAFFVEVGKANRAYNLFHAEFFRPFEQLVEKRFCNLEIVYNVEAGETKLFQSEFFICASVPDTGNSSCDFPVFICKEHFAIRKPESVVYFRVKFPEFVHI